MSSRSNEYRASRPPNLPQFAIVPNIIIANPTNQMIRRVRGIVIGNRAVGSLSAIAIISDNITPTNNQKKPRGFVLVVNQTTDEPSISQIQGSATKIKSP